MGSKSAAPALLRARKAWAGIRSSPDKRMYEVPILLLPGTPLIYVVTSVEAKPAPFWNPMGTDTPDEARERATLLPPELFNRFVNDAFWTVPGLNTHNVPVILHRD